MAKIAGIATSMLAADFSRLGEDIRDVCEKGADYIHVDVMDGAFVPNISFGADVMKSLNSYVTVPYDVHLMIEKPDRYLERFVTEKTEFITVHYEACEDPAATIEHIKSTGVKAGISINPGTAPEVLEGLLSDIDLVLVMSVEPGFGGQIFMESSIPKMNYLRERRSELGLSYAIEIDGGIGSANAKAVREAGADIIVSGSAVFRAADRKAEIEAIKGLRD